MKKIYQIITCFGLVALSVTNACKSDKKIAEPKQVILNANSTDINTRLTIESEVIPVVEYGDQKVSSTKNNNQISSVDISSNYNLRLIAAVKSPEYDGKILQATEVTVAGNLAYVSYNTSGPAFLGGIDVIDISDATKPKLLQSAITPGMDVSALALDGNNLYLAGALDIDRNTGFTYPAIAGRIVIEGGLLTDKITNVKLGGFAANSVSVDGANLYLTSGNTNGGISIIDKNTLGVKTTIAVDGAKDIAVSASEFTVLHGAFSGSTKQTLSVYDKITNKIKLSSDIPSGIHFDSKSNIAIAKNSILLSNGKSGITFWNTGTNVRIDYIGLPKALTDINDSDIYTNSVSVSDNYVYGANGAAGLAVSRINAAGNGLEVLGIADVKGSANYVKAAKGLIFVASGQGGLKIYALETKSTVTQTPGCEARSTLASNVSGTYNNNTGSKEYFKGTTVFKALNINDLFDFCGNLSIVSTLNVNSGGSLKVSGPLSALGAINVNKTVAVTGNLTSGSLTLNSTGTVELLQESTLKVNENMTINTGAILKVRGNLEIDGDLIFNGGTIEFIGNNNSVKIKGKVVGGSLGIVIGTYTGKIK